jgi:hypothetical protein
MRRNIAIAPFCNGPRFVNPSFSVRVTLSPGSCFCPGSAPRPPPDGVRKRIGRPIYAGVVSLPLGAMRPDLSIVPASGPRLGRLVLSPSRKSFDLLFCLSAFLKSYSLVRLKRHCFVPTWPRQSVARRRRQGWASVWRRGRLECFQPSLDGGEHGAKLVGPRTSCHRPASDA